MQPSQMGSLIQFCRKITLTADVFEAEGADFGVAFDGDFDRCFFDEVGQFMPGEYVVCLMASIFMEKEICAKIFYGPRVI